MSDQIHEDIEKYVLNDAQGEKVITQTQLKHYFVDCQFSRDIARLLSAAELTEEGVYEIIFNRLIAIVVSLLNYKKVDYPKNGY